MTSPNSTVPTAGDVLAWPVTVDVPTAGSCFGLGRDASYDLARTGEFPVPVLKLGRSLRVTRSALLSALGMDATAAPGNALATGTLSQFNRAASDHRSEGRTTGLAA